METIIFMLSYFLFGCGVVVGYRSFEKELYDLTLFDALDILTWPITLGILVTLALRKYLK